MISICVFDLFVSEGIHDWNIWLISRHTLVLTGNLVFFDIPIWMQFHNMFCLPNPDKSHNVLSMRLLYDRHVFYQHNLPQSFPRPMCIIFVAICASKTLVYTNYGRICACSIIFIIIVVPEDPLAAVHILPSSPWRRQNHMLLPSLIICTVQSRIQGSVKVLAWRINAWWVVCWDRF